MLASVLACLILSAFLLLLWDSLLSTVLAIAQCSGNVVECTGRKAKASAHPLTI